MEYKEEISEALRRDDLLQEIIQRLEPEDGEAWNQHKIEAQRKVCARYVDTLRLRGEDPTRLIPETVSKLFIVPLLKTCAAMSPQELEKACA